jgi:hypothetical protein
LPVPDHIEVRPGQWLPRFDLVEHGDVGSLTACAGRLEAFSPGFIEFLQPLAIGIGDQAFDLPVATAAVGSVMKRAASNALSCMKVSCLLELIQDNRSVVIKAQVSGFQRGPSTARDSR